MMRKSAEEFDKLCEIKDENERLKIGIEQFSRGVISAKAIRMLYGILTNSQKIVFLENMYNEKCNPYAEKNAERCPPRILRPEAYKLRRKDEKELICKLEGYIFLDEYRRSKIQNKFERFQKVIQKFSRESMDLDFYWQPDMMGKIIDNFFDTALKSEKYDTSKLNLPTNITFGVELEFIGIPWNKIKIPGKLADIFKDWCLKNDASVGRNKKMENGAEKKVENGAECVSPILEDSEKSWQSLERTCKIIQFLGGRANKTCGGHIHMNANVLGYDTKAWDNFLALWREAEPLIYLISNRRGEVNRDKMQRYAKPVEQSILDLRLLGSISEIKNQEDVKKFAIQMVGDDRYKGLNLKNLYASQFLGKEPINTIEFRIPNGTVDYNIIRENILLYGRMLQIAKLRSVEPAIKQKEWEDFMEPGLGEKEKMTRFLKLVFNSEKEKEIFFSRWEYNSGRRELISFNNRSYIRQGYPEIDLKRPKKMKEQIQELAQKVSREEQVAAMEAMMEEILVERQENETEVR